MTGPETPLADNPYIGRCAVLVDSEKYPVAAWPTVRYSVAICLSLGGHLFPPLMPMLDRTSRTFKLGPAEWRVE
jgi:hypothetical protein